MLAKEQILRQNKGAKPVIAKEERKKEDINIIITFIKCHQNYVKFDGD